MLQNPQWDVDTLVGLRDWMARQPPHTVYSWERCETCVVGKYLQANGRSHLDYGDWTQKADPNNLVARSFAKEHTFGAALANLDALMFG